MSNSSLVCYTKLSPHNYGVRNHAIDTISIHCMACNMTIERCGDVFNGTRQASSNYGVGSDGRIGMYVPENKGAFCTSSKSNDMRAVTIEVACESVAPYKVTDKAFEALIALCADICKRNGIKELKWQGNKALIGQVDKQNMTVHRWFAAKACPGDYLYNLHGEIARRVNELIKAPTPAPAPAPTPVVENKSFCGKGIGTATANESMSVRASAATNGKLYAEISKGTKVEVLEVLASGWYKIVWPGASVGYAYTSNATGKYYTYVPNVAPFKPYTIKTTVNVLNVRKGPGTSYAITTQIKETTKKNVYTIIEEKDGWGKLKSGAGWICLEYTKRA